MTPCISVVMSVYNGELYLENAIESILEQTFTDFEFIIVDDNSTDGSWAVLTRFSDPRVRLVRNQENIGLTRSLNKGLRLAQGIYIARMDADDISLPERFERQTAFFSTFPDIGLLGVAYWNMNSKGEKQNLVRPPTADSVIRWNMLFGPVLAHPGVMFRRDLIAKVGSYNENTHFAQDYELWSRMANVTKMANLNEPFLLYRQGDANRISEKHLDEQWDYNCAISARCIGQLLENDMIPMERVRKVCALIFLDRTCAEWNPQAARDLELILKRFLARYRTSLTKIDKEQIAGQIYSTAVHHVHRNMSIEEWQIYRQLLAAVIRQHLPLPKGRSIWRDIVKLALGRKATEGILKIRSTMRKGSIYLL